MYKILLILYFLPNLCYSQIGSVVESANYIKIYNTKMQHTKSISLSNGVLLDFNSKYILLKNNHYILIYNENGQYTGHSIPYNKNISVKINNNNIIINDRIYNRFYDFNGKYTGKSIKL